jgi:hypothetical protein
MARTIRTIEAVTSSAAMEVDRDEGIIRGVKILGLVSDNNRKYMPEAVRKAKSLYEGIKVNINHPAESGDVRNAEDRFGKLINVKYVEGEGLYGDLMFLKSHPMAERICEAAERNDMNDTFGLSHNAQGDGQEDDDGCFVVNSIVEVRHVDLVADPATTKSLREARTRMKANNRSIKEETDFENSEIKRYLDELLKWPTAKVLKHHVDNTGGYIKSKYTAAEMGGKQALIGDILRAKFPAKTVKDFFAWEDSKKKNKNRKPRPRYGDHLLGESDTPDDEDKEMTEASGGILGPIMKEITSNVSKAKEAIKTAKAQGATVRQKIKGSLGAKITAELNRVLYAASGALDTLAMQIHTMETDPTWAGEGIMPDDEFVEGEDMDDEDKEITEATNFDDKQLDWIRKNVYDASKMGKVKTLAKTAQAAISEINKWLMGANQNHSGPRTAATFGHYRDALTSVPVNSTLSDLANLDPSKYINNDAFSESKMREAEDVDEDEMMTEADDMPVEDPSEEEMTEAISLPDKQEARDFINQSSLALHKLMKMLKDVDADEDGAKTKQAIKTISSTTDKIIKELSSLDAQLLAASAIKESEDESEDEMMTEADDMPVEDPSEEEMTEGDGSSGDGSSYVIQQWEDGKFNKQGGPEYPTKAAAQAVADRGTKMLHPSLRGGGVEYRVVKIDRRGKVIKESDDMPVDETEDELAIEAEDDYTEEEYSDDEDKMAMESKRRLQQFCKTNGVVLTEGLLKDLKPLTEAAQRRCILRIKLASKARKPKSSGSMMPMTESKVHTGDNVFNWLRS